MASQQDTTWLRRPPFQEVGHRAWVRYQGWRNAAFNIHQCDTDRGWWAKVTNVSRRGVCVELTSPVQVDGLLLFELPVASGQPQDAVPERVVHATQNTAGNWLTGCEFVRPLSREELQLLKELI
jgi:hypothetical protein